MEVIIAASIDVNGQIKVNITGKDAGNKVAVLGLLEFVKTMFSNQPTASASPLEIANGSLPPSALNRR